MEQKKHEIWALCVLMVALLVLFSLVSFNGNDLTLFSSSAIARPPRNWIGVFGANVAWCLLFLFGLGAYGITLAGMWTSWLLFKGSKPSPEQGVRFLGMGLLVLSSVCLATLHRPTVQVLGQEILAGGEVGLLLTQFLATRLHTAGAHIVLVGLLLIALLLATPLSLKQSCDSLFSCSVSGARAFQAWLLRQAEAAREAIRQAREESAEEVIELHTEFQESREREAKPAPAPRPKAKELPAPAPPVQRIPSPLPPKKKDRKEVPIPSCEATVPGQYALPTVDLFDAYETDGHEVDWKKLEANSAVLEEKLSDFGVHGKVMAISPGPVITMYEYAPAPGIKISRIVGLSDDLSMALKAISIRVVAPIPGKAAIGIEIPNLHRELVPIQTVLDSEAFSASPSPLTIALGKDITGQPAVGNLAKMPHLLIAGATGTGKSVCINTILSSLLFRNSPNDMRMLLIDPKRIELNSYEGVPHLIHPVVTDAKMATRALRWAVQEMELRYRLLAEKNVRNIEGYNKALVREKAKQEAPAEAPSEGASLEHHHLPFIVIIIDELADLMMVASREVEESITRLAQMARAAGIHLILATQRPSVDVLTGIIKANIPTRISFQVSSRIDSRTIIDTSGAESLLGSGDMLFLPPGTAKLQRIHGAFISENEVQRLTSFWKAQQLSEDPLRERVNFQDQASGEGISEEELDEKYEEAIDLVEETRQASISMLQRRLRVGYNRAARMIELMEQQGIVGPSDGVKPREVHGRKD